MQRLADRGHHVDVQILDNEVSTYLKRTIVEDWCATYQLVSPNVHRRNVAEIAIRTSKAHFLAVLAGVDPNFPKFMWDNRLVQTEMTNQPSSASHTKPKHVSMGILQRCF